MSWSLQAARQAVDKLASSNIGYDQYQRWSFYDGARKQINPNSEADCSTMCGAIAHLGGLDVDLSGTWYTGNMGQKMQAAGCAMIPFQGLWKVQAGDFLLNLRNHVEFAYDANRFYSARIDERGRISGGYAGNQSGRETGFTNAYNYPWDYIIRPPKEIAMATMKLTSKSSDSSRFVVRHFYKQQKGKRIYDYSEIQCIDGRMWDIDRPNAKVKCKNNQRLQPWEKYDGAINQRFYFKKLSKSSLFSFCQILGKWNMNFAVDVAGDSVEEGALVGMYDANLKKNNTAQHFMLVPYGTTKKFNKKKSEQIYRVVHRKSGKFLSF